MDFPARLHRFRKAAKLSQEGLAVACGRSGQSWIGNFERGARRPEFDDIPKLAAALNIHPGELFADLPSQPTGLDPANLALAHRLLRDTYADDKREPYSVETDPELLIEVSRRLAVIGNDPVGVAALARSLVGGLDEYEHERSGGADPAAGQGRAAS